jgi:tRNA uridine 5-carboxymethylaminomethyl modification enzyme
VFLEPETLGGDSIYVNGLSTSLPQDVQEAVVHSVPGLQDARFLRYGYAVEYDVVVATQVDSTLACRDVPGLSVAGQLLGTSGYEEAAALGLMAGVNAVRRLREEPPVVLGREEAYIGVLVDDVCHRDHHEPYRMLTSRAEHRLVLGVDSARERLMARGVDLGLIRREVFHVQRRRWERVSEVSDRLRTTPVRPDRATCARLRQALGIDLAMPTTWAGILRRHDVEVEDAAEVLPALDGLSSHERKVVVGRLRYDGYLERHRRERDRVSRLRHLELPPDFDPGTVPGLSREVVDALNRARPRTVAEAERVPGVTPAAVAVLVGRLQRGRSAGCVEGGE